MQGFKEVREVRVKTSKIEEDSPSTPANYVEKIAVRNPIDYYFQTLVFLPDA
ncbi:MAG: hypothetical protein ACTSUE_19820 [Promethearchaeota archaeon]